MPWLQLEEENLDELMSTAQREGTLSRTKDSKALEMDPPAVVLVSAHGSRIGLESEAIH